MKAFPCIVFVTLHILPFVFARGETAALKLYPEANQLGYVASRTFSNEDNLPIKVIYYRSNHFGTGPVKEEHLVPSQIRLFLYENGKETWMGEYSNSFQLERSLETEYHSSGQKQKMRWRDGDGVVRYVMLFENQNIVAHVHYDQTGTEITEIKGKLPQGVDKFILEGKK